LYGNQNNTMTKILFSFLFITTLSSYTFSQGARKVQVAILFDTSNSMDGLLDQAKSRIWNIINDVSSLTHQGQTPKMEFAIYQYGNDGLEKSNHFIQQVLSLTGDMDLISQKLFSLRTNGGSEYCGAVIGKSLTDLAWSDNPLDLKMIYIAGNESFAQGPISYIEECKKAINKGVFINTIFCGTKSQGIKLFWEKGANCSSGDYFNIDSNQEIVQIDTPYDDQIMRYNDSLNGTYYGFGQQGTSRKSSQMDEDFNASKQSMSVAADRAVVKSKSKVYNNSSWDLIDAIDNNTIQLEDVKEADLPKEFRNKSIKEKNNLLETKKNQRIIYQEKIAILAKKRNTYIKAQKSNTSLGDDDFGTSVTKSIYTKAALLGLKATSPK